MNHGEVVSFIWGVADLIRDTFKRGKYQDDLERRYQSVGKFEELPTF